MAKATRPDDEQEMATVTSADGTEIAYERSGRGPPLVLVHASTVTHAHFESARPGLAEHFTVYGMDRRGHGEAVMLMNTRWNERPRTCRPLSMGSRNQ